MSDTILQGGKPGPGPQSPAAAYGLVAEFLGADWFLRPAVLAGMECSVTGRDGIPTIWHLHPALVSGLQLFVANHPGLRWDGAKPFTTVKGAS